MSSDVLFTTPRLVVRMLRAEHVPALVAYRQLPEVERYQAYDVPYTMEAGVHLEEGQRELTGPTPGEWTQFAVELRDGERAGEMIGDLACHLSADGCMAEIGYTLHPDFQGKGYAGEGADALVEHLLAHFPIHRLYASLDKENVASMRVLEQLGMTFESLTRRDFAMRGTYEDNLNYAMLREDREAWVARRRTPPDRLELVEITPDDAYLWGRLRTHHSQERFVSPMALSFRDALFPEVIDGAPVVPWMRGVLADGERVAFVMLAAATEHHPEPYLWRLLIDRMHQRRGIGSAILDELRRLLTEQGHRTLITSWGEGKGSPEPFYVGHGFVPTGRIVEGEVEARLSW